jgi:O-antigen/teichoic acid export membrane protein
MMIVIAYRGGQGRDLADPPTDLSRQMLKFGLRAHPGALSGLVWANAPVFLLNAFFGNAAVGIYSVAQQIVEKLLLPIQSMQDAIFKKISTLSREAAINTMNRYVRITWWLMAILMPIGMIFGPWLLLVFLGQKYVAAGQVCRWLLPGTAVLSVPFLLSVYFLGQLRRPGLLSILAWGNSLTSLILSLLLIPELAEIGAAIALTSSQILGTACALTLYLKMTKTPLKEIIVLDHEDFRIVRGQIYALLGRRGASIV